MAQVEKYMAKAPQGVNFTREPSQLEPTLWDEAENILFDTGATSKVSGIGQAIDYSKVRGGTERIEVILPYKRDQIYRYAYGVGTDIYSVQAIDAPHTDVSPPDSGAQPNPNYQWSGNTINGVGYMCKGTPYHYDPALEEGFPDGRFKHFDNFPAGLQFKSLHTFGNYLVGIGTEEGGAIQENRIWHSSSVNDTDIRQVGWNPTPENDANWVYIGGEGGALVGGLALKNDFILYREKSVHSMTFIGGNDVFSYRQVFDNFGMIAPNCAVEIEGKHFVLGVSDVYMHDGREKWTVAHDTVKQKLFDAIDPNHTDKCFVMADHKRKDVWVCIPERTEASNNPNGACTGAYVYDWVQEVWSYRTLPQATCGTYTTLGISSALQIWQNQQGSWASKSGTWFREVYNPANWGWVMGGQFNAVASNAFSSGFSSAFARGQQTYINTIYNDIEDKLYLGFPYEATMTKSWINFDGNDDRYKVATSVYPIVRGTGELRFDVGYSDYINGDIKWKTGYSYNTDRKNKPVGVRVTGRYFHLKFTIPEDSNVSLKGYNIDYIQGGKR